jgi:DNA-binding NarL/FixJ family response regulator
MPFRLLIVTSYRVFREALADVLDRETGLAVLATASFSQALDKVSDLAPDLTLLDVAAPEGMIALRSLVTAACGVPKLGFACKSAVPALASAVSTGRVRSAPCL